ncbi:hypothetical protein C5167_025809 [Papaver somniferum]|uniref:Reverse transcriptase RNase H-like domain-containing protein n=1 Tax=Papaver somniferum TaxID=3469 RepID=A0A4Y7JSJ1_PAPSO|nr:hypothetical protein C5167_025809 [Papaver somniferum]
MTSIASLAIWAALAHDMGNDNLPPIYYVSQVLREVEPRYPRVELACLALIYAAQKLRPYMMAQERVAVAASNPIAYLTSKPVLTGRTA